MLKTIGTFGAYASTTCLVISIILLLVMRKEHSIAIRKLSYFLYWNLAIELGAHVFMKMGMNNLPLLHVYTLGEFILLAIFYEEVLTLNDRQKKNGKIVVCFVALLIVLNSIFIQDVFGFNSYAKTLVNIILIGLSSLFLFQLLQLKTEEKSDLSSLAIVNSSILIYYSGSLLIFMFSDFFLKNSTGLPIEFWVFNVLINLIFQILILIAIWKTIVNKRYFSSLR